MANSILAKMAVQISANTAEFTKSLNSASSDLSKFGNNVKNIASTIGIAFGVSEVANFALDVSKLAGEADAVRVAFERLPNATRLMSELKRATGGTVSELELMKRAVQASNFDISLEALPRLLEFATLRAQQTGQSVDYLVDSIVTGIGRKSKLILDNLGISAAQLSAEFNGASLEAQSVGDVAEAVGRIAEKALGNMAGFSENASTKLQRLNASWENLKVSIGDAANESGIIGKSISGLTRFFDVLSGDEVTNGINGLIAGQKSAREELEKFVIAGGKIDLSWQELMARGFFRNEEAAKKYANILKEIQEQGQKIAKNQGVVDVDPLTGLPMSGGTSWFASSIKPQIQSINSLKQKLEELTATFNSTDESQRAKLKTIGDEIIKTEQLIKTLEELRKAQEAPFKSKANIGFGGSKTQFISANPIDQLQAQVGISSGSFTGSLAAAKVPGVSMPGKIVPGGEGDPFGFANIEKTIERVRQLANEVKVLQLDISNMIGGFISDMAYAFGQSMAGTVRFGDAFLRGLANFAVQFGEMLIAAGIAGKVIQDFAKNPALAVAAGVALVAIGSALSSELSSGMSKAAGGYGGSYGGGNGTRPAVSAITSNEQRVIIEMKAKGSDLVAVYDSAKADNRIRKGRG